MVKKRIFFIFIAMFLVFTIAIPNTINAMDVIENPDNYKPGEIKDDDTVLILEEVNGILSIISIVGIVISVITLIILGIKYMMGSVQERADYKSSMIPYLIGSLLLFGTTAILGIISTIIGNTELMW